MYNMNIVSQSESSFYVECELFIDIDGQIMNTLMFSAFRPLYNTTCLLPCTKTTCFWSHKANFNVLGSSYMYWDHQFWVPSRRSWYICFSITIKAFFFFYSEGRLISRTLLWYIRGTIYQYHNYHSSNRGVMHSLQFASFLKQYKHEYNWLSGCFKGYVDQLLPKRTPNI